MAEQTGVEAQNVAVQGWFSETYIQIKQRYMQLIRSPERSGDGLDSLQFGTKKVYGEIDQGQFRMKRYLVYRHKGAGKGFGGSKGSVWYDKNGAKHKTDPASFGKMGTGNRQEAEWLNPVLDEQVPKLADIVAGFKADLAVKQIQIK